MSVTLPSLLVYSTDEERSACRLVSHGSDHWPFLFEGSRTLICSAPRPYRDEIPANISRAT